MFEKYTIEIDVIYGLIWML